MVSIVGARCFAPDIGHAQRAPTVQGVQKLRSEAHISRASRDNDEVEAQSRSERDRRAFCETINGYLTP